MKFLIEQATHRHYLTRKTNNKMIKWFEKSHLRRNMLLETDRNTDGWTKLN